MHQVWFLCNNFLFLPADGISHLLKWADYGSRFYSSPEYLLLVSLPHHLFFSPSFCHIFSRLLIILYYLPSFYSVKFFFFLSLCLSPSIIHLSNLDRGQRKEVVEERRVSESERASAPAGVNICFRNLNNRPAVICISDNGQPYGSVDPRCAEVLSPHPSLFFISRRPFKFSRFFSFNQSFSYILPSTCHLKCGHILLFFFFFLTNILSLGHPLNPGYDPPHRAVTQVTMAAEPGIPTLCPARFQTSDRKQWRCMSGYDRKTDAKLTAKCFYVSHAALHFLNGGVGKE